MAIACGLVGAFDCLSDGRQAGLDMPFSHNCSNWHGDKIGVGVGAISRL